MGGGVSKSEYDRIRRELVLKDQVIRALQERLASGGHIGPMHITPPAPEHAGDDAATQAAGRVIASAMATKLREGSKVSRLSNAMPVTTATGTKGNRVSPSFAVAGDEDKLRLIDELETETASQPRTGTGRLESQGGMKGVVSTTASGKVRRVEVSAEVMPSHNFLAVQERVVYPKSESSKQLLLKVLQSNVLFQGQSRGEIHDCLDAFFPMQASPGDLVIQQGAQGDNFYAVESGQLEILVVANGAPPIRYGFLGPGLGFGELALLCNTPRAATIRAVTDVELWALERNTFREILASHKLNRLNRTLQVLHKVALLSKLTTAEMQQVAAAMDWEEFEAEAAIVRQGEVGEKFYIITKGDLVVTQLDAASGEHHTIRRLKAGDHFGEMALFKDDVRSATCTAVTRVQCVTLEREHFIAMLGTIQELMDREPAQLEAKEPSLVLPRRISAEQLADPAANYKYFMQIPREELEVLQTLGRGAFGRVKLVRHAASGHAYALKCLMKSRIVENNLKEHVINEKRVMLALDHPFILKLYTTFKDRTHLYFLVELALGGELFTYLRDRDHFDEPISRFYIASVVLVFQHMHSKSIAYRDLKPENILLGNDGFMKLADFGLAKRITDRTWTLCGTPDYLAPEIILNKGHDKAVDYWALGILIFELMTGSAPFFGQDPMQIYALIIQGNIKFPSYMGRACVDLVQKLLCQNPARRLGNMKHGIKDIINHRWFSSFQWESLRTKSMKPPIVPEIRDAFDTSNFEDFRHEVEDPGHECDWDPDF